jgi:hypothetical protein
MEQLKISQGIYAPLKFEMERDFASKVINKFLFLCIFDNCFSNLIIKVGRLPCLKSSNLMLSVLRGTDETLEIEDVLNSKFLKSEM